MRVAHDSSARAEHFSALQAAGGAARNSRIKAQTPRNELGRTSDLCSKPGRAPQLGAAHHVGAQSIALAVGVITSSRQVSRHRSSPQSNQPSTVCWQPPPASQLNWPKQDTRGLVHKGLKNASPAQRSRDRPTRGNACPRIGSTALGPQEPQKQPQEKWAPIRPAANRSGARRAVAVRAAPRAGPSRPSLKSGPPAQNQ